MLTKLKSDKGDNICEDVTFLLRTITFIWKKINIFFGSTSFSLIWLFYVAYQVHAGAGVLKVEGKSLQFSPAKPVDTKLSWHSQNYIPRWETSVFEWRLSASLDELFWKTAILLVTRKNVSLLPCTVFCFNCQKPVCQSFWLVRINTN